MGARRPLAEANPGSGVLTRKIMASIPRPPESRLSLRKLHEGQAAAYRALLERRLPLDRSAQGTAAFNTERNISDDQRLRPSRS